MACFISLSVKRYLNLINLLELRAINKKINNIKEQVAKLTIWVVVIA